MHTTDEPARACAWCQDNDPAAAWREIDGRPCCGSAACVAVLSCHECGGTGTEPGMGLPCGWCRADDRAERDDADRDAAAERWGQW